MAPPSHAPRPQLTPYQQKLLDPRWQKKRLEILSRDQWTCQECYDTQATLHVHHRLYIANNDPWDYPDHLLVTLCVICHQREGKERSFFEKRLLVCLHKAGFSAHDLQYFVAGFEAVTAKTVPPQVLAAALPHYIWEKSLIIDTLNDLLLDYHAHPDIVLHPFFPDVITFLKRSQGEEA